MVENIFAAKILRRMIAKYIMRENTYLYSYECATGIGILHHPTLLTGIASGNLLNVNI